MEYYIYENWHRDRGRIHKAECGFCNRSNSPDTQDRNGKWHGPFDRNGAFSAATMLALTDVRPCSACNP